MTKRKDKEVDSQQNKEYTVADLLKKYGKKNCTEKGNKKRG